VRLGRVAAKQWIEIILVEFPGGGELMEMMCSRSFLIGTFRVVRSAARRERMCSRAGAARLRYVNYRDFNTSISAGQVDDSRSGGGAGRMVAAPSMCGFEGRAARAAIRTASDTVKLVRDRWKG